MATLTDEERMELAREYDERVLMPGWYVWTTDPARQTVADSRLGECRQCYSLEEADRLCAEWNARNPLWPFRVWETRVVRPGVFDSGTDEDAEDDDSEQGTLW